MKNQERRLVISACLPPDQSDKDQLRLYKNAGFNVLYMTEDFVHSNSKAYFDCLKYAEEVGLSVYLKEHMEFPNYWSKHFSHVDIEKYPSVTGFYIKDEPNKEEVYQLAKEYLPFFKEKGEKQGKAFFLNTYCGETTHFMGSANDYMDLLMELVYNKLDTDNKYLSLDEYPLRRTAEGKNYMTDAEWVPYTAQAARKCRDNGVRFGSCLQTFGGEWCDCRMPKTVEEIRFMAYLYLAFGAQHLDYFVYRTSHKWDFMGMVNEAGAPSNLYYIVKQVNEELLSFDREYLTYSWTGALVIDGARNETPNKPFIKTREFLEYEDKDITVEKAEKDLIVGCFERGKRERAYILVSYGEPTVKEGNTVTLTFKNAKKVSVQRNGVKETVELENGKLILEMKQGEGVFAIPLYKK